MDLGSLASVEAFVQSFQKRNVDLLVHNAGVMAVKDHRTRDGFETTFQVNHLAPFLLTLRLFPSLRDTRPSRREGTSMEARDKAADKRPETLQHGGMKGAVWGRGVRVVWVSSGLHKFGSVPDGRAERWVEGQTKRERGEEGARRERGTMVGLNNGEEGARREQGTMGGLVDIAHQVRGLV